MPLGKVTPDADTPEVLYQAPAGKRTSVGYIIKNTSNAEAVVSLHLHPSGEAAGQANAIEWQETLPAKGRIQQGGLVIETGDVLTVESSGAEVNFFAMGVEAIA